MMKNVLRATFALAALGAGQAMAACGSPDPMRTTLDVVGLTSSGSLVCFTERKPNLATPIGMVTGLDMDTALVGIDFRVQDGKLYGVGNQGGVYSIDTTTAVATLVNRLSVALEGSKFGVDFNPAADRLRITSDTGQNLRHNVNAGGVTIADTALSYPTTVVGNPNTPGTNVIGGAYTNNDLSSLTGTSLFDLDATNDTIVLQSPANAGLLAAAGKFGLDVNPDGDLDIYSTITGGVTTNNRAYAVAISAADGISRFYMVNLLTGKATQRGAFPRRNPVVDIAVPLAQNG